MTDEPQGTDTPGRSTVPPGAAGPATSAPHVATRIGAFRGWHRFLPAVIAIIAVVLVAFGVQWLVHRLRFIETDDAQVKGDMVLVAARHSGTITELPVVEGQHLKQGELIARLDAGSETVELERARAARERAAAEHEQAKSELTLTQVQVQGKAESAVTGVTQSREGLEQAREDLRLQGERARRGIERAEAGYGAAGARVARALDERDNALRDLERIRTLFLKGVVAEAERDRAELLCKGAEERLHEAREDEAGARAQLETARAELRMVEIKRRQETIAGASLERAHADLRLARDERARIQSQELNLKILEAGLRQAEAAERAAQLRLDECTITSPVDGVVARKIADLGETLGAGQPVVVITDPERVWIEANVKETALRKVRIGAPADVTVDALPGRTFRGRVAVVNAAANSQYALLPSGNPSGQFIKVTQRVAVRIELDQRDPLIRPGMMAIVDIKIP